MNPEIRIAASSTPEPNTGCWLWLGYTNRDGYGCVAIGGRRWLAPRLALESKMGRPIGKGLCACHRCDTPACVNPAHLFEGSRRDNTRDAMRKGRLASGDRNGARLHPERVARGDRHPLRRHPELIRRGEENSFARLAESDVVAIRRAYALGVSQKKLGHVFGVNRATIGLIVRRETWGHVQ